MWITQKQKLLDRNGVRIHLERLDVSEADKLLGVWIAMDGNQDKQIDITKKKAQEFAAQISTKKVSQCFVHI